MTAIASTPIRAASRRSVDKVRSATAASLPKGGIALVGEVELVAELAFAQA
jgi:hypothetical protein